jgi:uncharacterized protein (TIGR00255 family)
MISSMTGYGKTVAEFPGKKFTIEIKALNSKAMDLSVKLPMAYRDKELEIRALLLQKLHRGKVDLTVFPDEVNENPSFRINKEVAKKYHSELKSLAAEMGEEIHDSILPVVVRLPDVIQPVRMESEEAGWVKVKEAIEKAIGLVEEFRLNEGQVLGKDMMIRVNLILGLLDSIAPFEAERIEEIRDRIRSGFQNFQHAENMNMVPDNNRFEQELIYYLERLDITEEKVRLRKHCDYFIETLNDPDSQGKKLGFISQEIGREINTIGSKANKPEIQKIVVQMKDELEKIREQLGNIL